MSFFDGNGLAFGRLYLLVVCAMVEAESFAGRGRGTERKDPMKRTRWLSFLLAMVMVLSVMPGSAWAAGTEGRRSVEIQAVFHQESARSMLAMINEFRTGPEAWEWNADNTEKIWHSGLQELKYDYHLEQIAMQRAVEIALSFSHTRPNGEICFTATYEGTQSYAENIAASGGPMDAARAMELWKETEEPYAGQGHRRNMLSAERVHIGIGHVSVDGRDFWVQEMSFDNSGAARTEISEEPTLVSVEVADKDLQITRLTYPRTLEVVQGETLQAPAVEMDFRLPRTWPDYVENHTTLHPAWVVKDPDVAACEGGVVTAKAAGKTTLEAALGDRVMTVELTVVPPHVHAGVLVPGKAPTCTQSGVKDYYRCSCGKLFEDAAATREIENLESWQLIPATGHDWGEAVYEFAADGSACTARRVCRNDGCHQENAQAQVTEKVTKAPTCTERGETTYTAVFQEPWAKKQTLTVADLPMKEHHFVWVIDREPTALEAGQKHLECTVCGRKQEAVRIPCLPLEAPVLTVERQESSGAPMLSWSAVEGAREYEVWCSVDGEEAVLLHTTDGTRLRNGSARPGEERTYWVRAMGEVPGQPSQEETILCTCAQPQLAVTLRDGKPYLTWNKISGADGYEIWCSVDGDEAVLLHTTTGTRLRNGSAKAGEERSYQVRAIVKAKPLAGSIMSEAIRVVCPVPVPQLRLTALASTGKTVVSWEKIDGATGYEVWVKERKNDDFRLLKTVRGTRLTHSSAHAGTTYYYQARAVAGDKVGEFSDVKYRTCDLGRPTVKVGQRSGDPYLTWNRVSGAAKYEVWCADGTGSYKKLITTGGTRLTHGSAKRGHTYYYKVRSICSNRYASSAYSVPVSVEAK